jgi:hypothetical protein
MGGQRLGRSAVDQQRTGRDGDLLGDLAQFDEIHG